jgi:hypothetical protein
MRRLPYFKSSWQSVGHKKPVAPPAYHGQEPEMMLLRGMTVSHQSPHVKVLPIAEMCTNY